MAKPLKCFPSIRVGQVIKTAIVSSKDPIQDSASEYKIAKVRIQTMKMDKHLLMYFPNKRDKWCRDDHETRIGDIVVVKNLEERLSRKVFSKIDSIMYKVGITVDPLTGRQCRGTDFIDDRPDWIPEKPTKGGKRKKVLPDSDNMTSVEKDVAKETEV